MILGNDIDKHIKQRDVLLFFLQRIERPFYSLRAYANFIWMKSAILTTLLQHLEEHGVVGGSCILGPEHPKNSNSSRNLPNSGGTP